MDLEGFGVFERFGFLGLEGEVFVGVGAECAGLLGDSGHVEGFLHAGLLGEGFLLL